MTMSEGQESRADRVARYKEERRKQLAAQFGNHSDPSGANATVASNSNNKKYKDSSGSEGPRTTRASRLRAAASAQENGSSPRVHKPESVERSMPLSAAGLDTSSNGGRRIERDKSSKRKSNLNRSLNSEEVPFEDSSDTVKSRRRRRRFFPQEILKDYSSTDDKAKSDTSLTASLLSPSSTSPLCASPTPRPLAKKNELSVHMENARKGVTASFSEMGKYKPFAKRAITSPRGKLDTAVKSDHENSASDKDGKSWNKENSRKKHVNIDSKITTSRNTSSDNDVIKINRKMEELNALTKETLARVEKLASRNKDIPKMPGRSSNSPMRPVTTTEHVPRTTSSKVFATSHPSSILKKKSIEEPIIETVPNAVPVSILKRKVSQDDHNRSEGASSTHTPPVTFSPSVVEPATTNRKQGILKKRRSLDESQVMRHRSCSPDVANKASDSRSILKCQRRSSLEELRRTQSPEMHLHGILKRKTSRTEDDDHSLNSPQGILKRRSGASSAGSTTSTPHVSITTAVILAAAGGAEMVLEPELVKPILKKKSFSEEHPSSEASETPKPILKKKSSTDTDDCDDKPKKPILKMSRNSIDRDHIDFSSSMENRTYSNYKSSDDCDVKPILRQNSVKEDGIKPRLSFCGEPDEDCSSSNSRYRSSRRSHPNCNEFNAMSSKNEVKEEDRELRKARPLSVSDLVKTFESTVSTGAIPKRSSLKRYSDRYKTQPVTSNELEASLNYVRSPQLDKSSPLRSPDATYSASSLLNFTSSLEHDSNLNSFLSSSFNDTHPDSGICGKMSSDSAFQSLGDGLELDQEDDRASTATSARSGKLEPSKLELQMKAIAEEAQKIKLRRGNSGASGVQKFRSSNIKSPEKSLSRFSTQPVTFEEIQEAAKLGKDADGSEDQDSVDPANLTLFERIKLFSSVKVDERELGRREVPRRRLYRFQTQPVTSDDIETARCISPSTYILGERSNDPSSRERKGILKASSGGVRCRRDESPPPPPQPKSSILKKHDSFHRTAAPKIEISDVTYDEGISCNDSGSDSEVVSVSAKNVEVKVTSRDRALNRFGKSSSDTTSDGESSGGREIRSIFKSDNRLRMKQTLESVLSKSKSQSTVGDEPESTSRKTTSSIRRSQTQAAMPRTIAELQAKLQQSGESGWRKRANQNNNTTDELKLLIDKNKYNDELSEKSILALKKDELDAASQQWKSRVEKADAEKFSIAGRMDKTLEGSPLPINIPSAEKNKRKPQAKRFKGKEGSDTSSTPVSPDQIKYPELTRSYSVPEPEQVSSSNSDSSEKASGRKVAVNRPDDFTFKNFYRSVEEKKSVDYVDFSLDDLDSVTRQSLLVQKKNVQVQKRRGATKNPIKALASRTDITDEYTEVITGVAEREKRRLNIEKLAKSSNLAVEALAGLASNEDFKSVALKKSSSISTMVPFKNVMLLQVKGRRHVQTRLVEPIAASINEGDNYILVTGNSLYNYIGSYANVIEQSRAVDIVNHIQQTGDLGCKVDEVITINEANRSSISKQVQHFWKLLDCQEEEIFTEGGNPSEDEIYESNILSTNMIYKLEDNELVPWEEYWGGLPKIEMLEPTRVIVFDFGSEMYVWSGKNAPLEQKRRCLKLAKELWDDGYNYTECNVCPLNVALILGNRPLEKLDVKASKRPDWALFAKITQHRETILFKEKFLDWPDFSRVIKVKMEDGDKVVDPSYDIRPCNVDDMLKEQQSEPDFSFQGYHLGRGKRYFDEETRRLFEFDTIDISKWRILENSSERVPESSVAHFYDGDGYIIRWNYRMTVKGRELTGKPSKYAQVGRDKCIYFYWQGVNASINEKGYAALLTVELDNEKAPQISVAQGHEPAAFLGLFNGSMVVHSGKSDDADNSSATPRLFTVKAEKDSEICLVEVPCEAGQLRSRSSFIVVDTDEEQILIWHGCKSSDQKRTVTRQAANKILENRPSEFFLEEAEGVEISEMEEGQETQQFANAVAYDSDLYYSLLDDNSSYDFTLRLFHLSSVLGSFNFTEILCPYRSEYSSPYPFSQSELYTASQPALFLIDNHHELWLWQGWWPDTEECVELSDQTGSGAVRWQAERKAAMQTAIDYWRRSHDTDETVPAYLVWAGLEPVEFKCLFPRWVDKEDVTELNLKEGKKPNSKLPLERELALLSRTTYPLAELLQRPLPDGVDPTHLEIYLSPDDFQEFLSMTKEEFQKLPPWKQTAVKKEKGLF